MTAPLIAIAGLTVDFDTGRRVVRALHGVDLAVARGEAVGLVGESGSGKSVTWLAALGLLGPRARIGGSARLDGVELVGAPVRLLETVRGRRIAMIFQDPSSSLNPVHRIGRQIGEALALHRGLAGPAARAEAVRLLDRVGIPAAARRLDDYPHQLSGGQNQRVMIAMALAGEPDLLVADEPTTALDATIQAQILKLLGDLRRDSDMALVLISHDLGVVAENCDRVAVMYAGRFVESGMVEEVMKRPLHPYTQGLMGSTVHAGLRGVRLAAIPGAPPDLARLPPGCAFAPRCPHAEDACRAAVPAEKRPVPEHMARCIRIAA